MEKKCYLRDPQSTMCYEVAFDANGQLTGFKVLCNCTEKFQFVAKNIGSFETYSSLEELKEAFPECFT